MFCSIHDFTFLMTNTKKIKGQVSFESPEKKKLLPAWFSAKFVVLPAQSISLANWFACMPSCMSAIVCISLTSLKRQTEIPQSRIFPQIWMQTGSEPCSCSLKNGEIYCDVKRTICWCLCVRKNYLGKALRIEMLIYPSLPPLIPLLWETDSYKVLWYVST